MQEEKETLQKRLEDAEIRQKALGVKMNVLIQEHSVAIDKLINKIEKLQLENSLYKRQKGADSVNYDRELLDQLTVASNKLDEYLAKKNSPNQLLLHTKSNLDALFRTVNDNLEEELINQDQKKYIANEIVDVSNIISGLTALYTRVFEPNGSFFKFNVKEGVYAKAPALLIEKVVRRLMENALHLSISKGEMFVELTSKANKLIITISHTGTFIPEFELEHVFVPFYRLNKTKNSVGYDLGLCTIKKIVALCGGTINIESTKEIGIRYIVEFEEYGLKPDERPKDYNFISELSFDTELTPADEENAPQCPLLMFIDPNNTLLGYIKLKLSGVYNLMFANSGEEAMRKLRNLEAVPDLIISEYHLKDTNGVALKRSLDKEPKCKNMPILFLSASTLERERVLSIQPGVLDYLIKPFKWVDIKVKIDLFINIAQVQKERYMNNPLIQKPFVKNYEQLRKEKFELNCKKYELTSREKEIVQLMSKVTKSKDIAVEMNVTINTVQTHIKNIYSKLNVNSKTEALSRIFG